MEVILTQSFNQVYQDMLGTSDLIFIYLKDLDSTNTYTIIVTSLILIIVHTNEG